jgi:hypothetical protein
MVVTMGAGQAGAAAGDAAGLTVLKCAINPRATATKHPNATHDAILILFSFELFVTLGHYG